MPSIYDNSTLQSMLNRIDKLTPGTQPQWGKMNVAQMLAHCSAPIEVALGEKTLHVPFMMKLFAPLIKATVVGSKPFKQGLPTPSEFKMVDQKDFDQEKSKLTSLVSRLSKGGPEGVSGRKHPIFGALTPAEWDQANVKHLEHHLKQFGV